jgi:hypothetical protein
MIAEAMTPEQIAAHMRQGIGDSISEITFELVICGERIVCTFNRAQKIHRLLASEQTIGAFLIELATTVPPNDNRELPPAEPA